MQTDWILRTDRLPKKKDADSNDDVWVSQDGEVRAAKYWSAMAQDLCDAWQPKAPIPEPYEPPKPKRRRWWIWNPNGTPTVFLNKPTDPFYDDGNLVEVLEALPDDPGWDELLEVIDGIIDTRSSWHTGVQELQDSMDHWVVCPTDMKKLMEARSRNAK
jgi:hypothetical protein